MSPTVVDLLRSATALQALTLKGPWGELVVAGKDVENRTWAPPPQRVGGLLAIHQGVDFDPGAADWVSHNVDVRVPGRHKVKRGVVLAVAVLARVVKNSPSPWAMAGQHHWCLKEVVALQTPVQCKGAQGLWTLPATVLHQVREQVLDRHAQAGAALALSPAEGPAVGMEKVAAEAWAATRNPGSFYGLRSLGRFVACAKCGGLYKQYGEGPTGAHAPRVPIGAGPDWPTCPHGAAMFADCKGDPCAPPCCQRSSAGGAP